MSGVGAAAANMLAYWFRISWVHRLIGFMGTKRSGCTYAQHMRVVKLNRGALGGCT